ncbi:MAG: hypothetical protein UHK59_06970 [Acutalibacteraceae bacterium]|nr:hypothetical protein [Acutalibacteraceae bacterium]
MAEKAKPSSRKKQGVLRSAPSEQDDYVSDRGFSRVLARSQVFLPEKTERRRKAKAFRRLYHDS